MTSETPKLLHRGWIYMQVGEYRSRLVRKSHSTLVKPNSADTKTECSPVNFDFQNWNAEEERLTDTIKQNEKRRRAREGWLTSICVWMKVSCAVFSSLKAQQTWLRGDSLGEPFLFCGLEDILNSLNSALNQSVKIKLGNGAVKVWK